MNLNVEKKLVIVLRTHNERTVDLCMNLLSDQLTLENIHVVQEVPFLKAVQKTFEIGMRHRDKPYLLALDADVMLFSDALNYMLNIAEDEITDQVFRVDYFVYDKFRGRKDSGVHFYNNRHSEKMLEFLMSDRCIQESIKPEYYNIHQFSTDNNLIFNVRPHYMVGKHDYFQYYKDIFHKYQLRYKRSVKSQILDKDKAFIYQKMVENIDDMDYRVAFESFCGQDQFSYEELMNQLNLKEKESIAQSQISVIKKYFQDHQIMKNVIK